MSERDRHYKHRRRLNQYLSRYKPQHHPAQPNIPPEVGAQVITGTEFAMSLIQSAYNLEELSQRSLLLHTAGELVEYGVTANQFDSMIHQMATGRRNIDYDILSFMNGAADGFARRDAKNQFPNVQNRTSADEEIRREYITERQQEYSAALHRLISNRFHRSNRAQERYRKQLQLLFPSDEDSNVDKPQE